MKWVMWLYSLFLLGQQIASAHTVGLSVLHISLKPSEPMAFLMAKADAAHIYAFDQNGDDEISDSEFEAKKALFGEFIAESFSLSSTASRGNIEVDLPDQTTIRVRWRQPLSPGKVKAASTLFEVLPPDHKTMVLLQEGTHQRGSAFLTRENPQVEFEVESRSEESVMISATGFFLHGLEHIASGWDHILFVLALLMTGAGFKSILKIITAFTVSHSITLALAATHVISMPARVVEPVIALSIVYVALDNVFRKGEHSRWLIAGLFGLIHGFGFATAASHLFQNITGWQFVVPLASFNIGIEVGQIVIATLVLPLLWKMKDWPLYGRRILPVGSMAIAAMGLFWFVERVWL